MSTNHPPGAYVENPLSPVIEFALAEPRRGRRGDAADGGEAVAEAGDPPQDLGRLCACLVDTLVHALSAHPQDPWVRVVAALVDQVQAMDPQGRSVIGPDDGPGVAA